MRHRREDGSNLPCRSYRQVSLSDCMQMLPPGSG